MMERMRFKIWTPAVLLLLVAMALAACSGSSDPEPEPPMPEPVVPTAYTLTVKASKSNEALTRALYDDNGTLNTGWSKDDVVEVYRGEMHIGTLKAQSAGANTTLTGTVSGLSGGETLSLRYLAPDYSAQDGTLSYIASHCDYATAIVTVDTPVGTNITTSNASFTNQQAIVRFTLVDDADGATTLVPTAVSLKAGETTVNASVTSDAKTSAGVVYYAIPGFENKDVTLMATVGGHPCTIIRQNVTFANGQFYAVKVKLYNPYEEPLTFEATKDNTQISFADDSEDRVEYSRNKSTWTDVSYVGNYVTIDAGEKVYFRGNKKSYYSAKFTISCEESNCYVYGNIMSLLYPTEFGTQTSLPDTDYTFCSLFKGNANLANHAYKDLVLPATTLTAKCYQEMFAGCTGLTRAPVLPAAKISTYGYYGMFAGCSSLSYIKCLATDISADNCTTDWVENVNSDGVFVTPSTTEWSTGASAIPEGWEREDF